MGNDISTADEFPYGFPVPDSCPESLSFFKQALSDLIFYRYAGLGTSIILGIALAYFISRFLNNKLMLNIKYNLNYNEDAISGLKFRYPFSFSIIVSNLLLIIFYFIFQNYLDMIEPKSYCNVNYHNIYDEIRNFYPKHRDGLLILLSVTCIAMATGMAYRDHRYWTAFKWVGWLLSMPFWVVFMLNANVSSGAKPSFLAMKAENRKLIRDLAARSLLFLKTLTRTTDGRIFISTLMLYAMASLYVDVFYNDYEFPPEEMVSHVGMISITYVLYRYTWGKRPDPT